MNRAALTKLADHLATNVSQAEFAMEDYCSECGTIGCAAFHATKCVEPLRGRDWGDYEKEVFHLHVNEWLWCFSGSWARVDNTPAGAASRIRHLLNSGLPEDFRQQMRGQVPISY